MPLTAEDIRVFASMKNRDVLKHVDAHRLDEREGVILVTCADGDRFVDIFRHHSGICEAHRGRPRIHTFSLNGGALLIPASSCLNRELHEDRVLLAHIEAARGMKGIHTVALYAHRPCGAATQANLTFEQTIELLLEAKARVKRDLSRAPHPVKVACFLHIAQDEERRTYFVSREAWERWKTGQERFAAVPPT